MEPSAAGRFIIGSMTFSETPRRVSQPALVGSDEAAWIAQARVGSEQAWQHLVRTHQEAAFRLAYLLLRDAADAEDVAQEAFVRAYLSLTRFDETRPFRPWLLQITRNLARNHRRSLRRYLHHLIHWDNVARETAVTPPPQTEPARAQLLGEAVQKLPAKGQEIVYLRYFLELSEAETAVSPHGKFALSNRPISAARRAYVARILPRRLANVVSVPRWMANWCSLTNNCTASS
jgi:RNA polymerase sigma-70 factor, ECF subfamily